ncbi:MAG TPA: helix-turn-helix transcriptional regulator [Bdellovibrionales bacterium]|nr:helix-turn-helix transcriptional regulator [Bdellovibrionales bacterium]
MRHHKFGSFLKKARESRKYSQGDVAKVLGYTSAQFISNLERGISPPPLKVLKVLVKLYAVKPDEVMRVIEEEQRRHMKENLARLRKALK